MVKRLFRLESSWEALPKFLYLVRCSLDKLSCDSHRWLTLPVCHSALTAGNWQSWGTGEHSRALPVYSIHERCLKLYTINRFKTKAKGSLTFIDKGFHE